MVGEGDFSFARAVASAVGGDRLVCTSLDKATQLQVKYDNKVNGILGTLHGLGAKTHHNVDATNLKVFARVPHSCACAPPARQGARVHPRTAWGVGRSVRMSNRSAGRGRITSSCARARSL
jgi:hypothetical protein